jgi:hypothetical protein
MGRDRTSARGRRPRVEHANLGVGFLVRMVVLAFVAVIGSAWGLVRFYTRVHPPMVIPVAPDAGSPDGGEELFEAPELEVERK